MHILLHFADCSSGGYDNICMMLLAKGADPTIVNNKEETAAQVATTNQLRTLLSGILRGHKQAALLSVHVYM
jgi:ankyrin repeat protein